MAGEQRRTRAAVLAAMVVLAIGYGGGLALLGTLTGSGRGDGALGVLLGLFISAQPAANAVDLLFAERGGWGPASGGWRQAGWLALNVGVLGAGWAVIVAGAIRLAGAG